MTKPKPMRLVQPALDAFVDALDNYLKLNLSGFTCPPQICSTCHHGHPDRLERGKVWCCVWTGGPPGRMEADDTCNEWQQDATERQQP